MDFEDFIDWHPRAKLTNARPALRWLLSEISYTSEVEMMYLPDHFGLRPDWAPSIIFSDSGVEYSIYVVLVGMVHTQATPITESFNGLIDLTDELP